MKRPLFLAVAIAAALAACNGDDTADPTTTSAAPTPSTSEAPTSTAPPTTEPPPTSAPTTTAATTTLPAPTTVATTAVVTTTPVGEADWRLVLETLGRRRQELYSAPDLARIGEVCAPDSQCQEQLDVQLGDMVNKGWHVGGADPYTVLSAEVEDFTGPSLEEAELVVLVNVVQRLAVSGQIVDGSGTVVAELETDTPEGSDSRGRAFLARVGPPDDPWRLVDQESLGEVPAG